MALMSNFEKYNRDLIIKLYYVFFSSTYGNFFSKSKLMKSCFLITSLCIKFASPEGPFISK